MDRWMAAFNLFGYCLESVRLPEVGPNEDQHDVLRRTWQQFVARYFPDHAWARFDLDCYDLFDLQGQKIGSISISDRDPRQERDWDIVPGVTPEDLRIR